MNQQQDKEDGGLGSNAQRVEPKSIKRCIPKSKRIKIDDPNMQPIKRNHGLESSIELIIIDKFGSATIEQQGHAGLKTTVAVDDEEAHSHSSTRERPFERKSEEPFVPFLEDVEEPEMSAFDYMMSQLRPKWQQELAKRGIDIKTLEQANWEGTCGSCGDVDKHETLDCPYAEFIDT
ncbi:hypothetical protein LguiA_017662 [Lonicera macranthoides]